MSIQRNVLNNLLGVYSGNQQLLRERNEVIKMYNIYEGAAKTEEMETNEITRGQSWQVPIGLDYTPTQEIRNHIKKLLKKQARFMFGTEPTILFSPYQKEDKQKAEEKKQFIEMALTESEFWTKTFKAFLDCTIGKRVLLIGLANPQDTKARFRYYTMPSFTYETFKEDESRLKKVIIAYEDPDTIGKNPSEQIWHRYEYIMQNGVCIYNYATYDGNGEIEKGTEETLNTGFEEIPGKVILNGGLTGTDKGESDVTDLVDLAGGYNTTVSDFRDALRFKLFEQTAFIDADSKSMEGLTVAPGSTLDVRSDPATDKQAKIQTVGAEFNFTDPAEKYLNRAKEDMYEIMDMPRPQDLKNIPSAKSLKFTFYDLMSRCTEKWKDWEPALLWACNFILDSTERFNLYSDNYYIKAIGTEGIIGLKQNYPIPEDEAEQKKTAIAEVDSKVKSIKQYVREYGDVVDEVGEFEEIIAEQKEINETMQDSFATQAAADQSTTTSKKTEE